MKRKLMIAGIVIGAILAIGPFVGMMGATFSMFSATFSDPRALSSHLGTVRFFQRLGLFVCPLGLGLLIVCTIKLQTLRRQPPPLPPS